MYNFTVEMPGRHQLNQVFNITSIGEKKQSHVLLDKMKQGKHNISDDTPAKDT